MNEWLLMILSLSLAGTLLALFLLIIKQFVHHKISKTLQYYIWLIVLIRLVVPVGLPINNQQISDNYVSQISSTIIQSKTPVTVSKSTAISGENSNVNETKTVANEDMTYPAANSFLSILFNNLFFIWLMGTLVCFMIQIIAYLRLYTQLMSNNNPTSINKQQTFDSEYIKSIPIYTNHFVNTPLLLGLVRTCIIIPDIKFSEDQLKNIYLHEITHFHRKDILIKWIIVFITSIHWFNPMMYFIKREISRASELACDEAVIKTMNNAQKQSYGETLLFVAADHRCSFGAIFTTMSEDKKTLKERLIAIMKHKNSKRVSAATCISLLLVVLCTAVSCSVVKTPTSQSSTNSNSTEPIKTSSTDYSNSNESCDFTEITCKGFKTNNDGSCSSFRVTISDAAFMNKIWKTMNTTTWTETSKPYIYMTEDTLIHLTGEKSDWYAISSNNTGYYHSDDDGTELDSCCPFGGFAKDIDKNYTLPSNVYKDVMKLINDYMAEHPANLKDMLVSLVYDGDLGVIYQENDVQNDNFTTAQFEDAYLEAFGDLDDWKIQNTDRWKGFNNVDIAMISSNDTNVLFSKEDNLAFVNVLGEIYVYQVPDNVIPNIIKLTEELHEKSK